MSTTKANEASNQPKTESTTITTSSCWSMGFLILLLISVIPVALGWLLNIPSLIAFGIIVFEIYIVIVLYTLGAVLLASENPGIMGALVVWIVASGGVLLIINQIGW